MAASCRPRLAAQPSWLRTITSIKHYGSSAAAQVQYDYDEEEDFESDAWRGRDRTIGETDGSETGRGVQWVIMGDPLAKKHVYAEKLSKLLQVPHISMGALVRQELHPLSSLYKQIANAVNQGKLVPEDIIFGLLSKRLEEGYSRGETGFILDGIPRTRIQAEILDQIADIDLVVNFKCTEDCLLNHQHMRTGIYSPGKEFLSLSKPGYASSSSFDTEVAWKDKLSVHAEQSKQLGDYYRQQKKILDFQAAGAPGETWQGLLAALHLQHVDAISSSQKLTA